MHTSNYESNYELNAQLWGIICNMLTFAHFIINNLLRVVSCEPLSLQFVMDMSSIQSACTSPLFRAYANIAYQQYAIRVYEDSFDNIRKLTISQSDSQLKCLNKGFLQGRTYLISSHFLSFNAILQGALQQQCQAKSIHQMKNLYTAMGLVPSTSSIVVQHFDHSTTNH